MNLKVTAGKSKEYGTLIKILFPDKNSVYVSEKKGFYIRLRKDFFKNKKPDSQYEIRFMPDEMKALLKGLDKGVEMLGEKDPTVKFKGKITNILHDANNKKSTLWLGRGKQEVKIIRPMTPKYEWKRHKGDKIESGDEVEVIIRKITKKS